MTVLNSWINLAQKGYFGTKKLKIQINLDSTNKLDFWNKFQKTKIYFRLKTQKNEHVIAIFWNKFFEKGSYFQSKTDKIDTAI